MNVLRACAIIAALTLGAVGCGSDDATVKKAQSGEANEAAAAVATADASADLPRLTRALIPEEALDRAYQELAVEECGIAPVFPCVRAYFVVEDLSLEERVALIREQARAAGWTIVSEQRDPGVIIEIAREPLQATYMVEAGDPLLCKAAPRCVSGTMLTVFGPTAPLPAPSEAERALWSAARTRFVRDANSVCAEMLARTSERPEAFVEALAVGMEQLAALKAPAGDERKVEEVLRPLRVLVRAARALTDDRGEDALPAAVAVGEFAKRFNRAASRYGLDRCAAVG